MKTPTQITFHGLSHSDAIASKIMEAAEKLNRMFAEIVSCRVVVDLANRRHKKGNLYRIHIDVSVPGAELNVGREPGDRKTHKDVLVAVRDAFNAMERRLQDYAAERRGEIKRSGGPAAHGRVSELLREDASRLPRGANGRPPHNREPLAPHDTMTGRPGLLAGSEPPGTGTEDPSVQPIADRVQG